MSTDRVPFPLPWTIVKSSWRFTTVYDAHGQEIFRVDIERWGCNEDNQSLLDGFAADLVPLLAAAPKMLAALKHVQEHANFAMNGADRMAVKKIVEPAIAEAEGTT